MKGGLQLHWDMFNKGLFLTKLNSFFSSFKEAGVSTAVVSFKMENELIKVNFDLISHMEPKKLFDGFPIYETLELPREL